VFNGCGGPAEPTGFPKLVRPVTIKVHKNGEPLSDVTVILHPKDTMLPFLMTGKTGADGVATIRTSRNTYSRPGAPVGKFLVQLTEVIEVDMQGFAAETSRELTAWSREYDRRMDALRRFSKALDSADSSPLEMDITSSVAAEFDVTKYASPKK